MAMKPSRRNGATFSGASRAKAVCACAISAWI